MKIALLSTGPDLYSTNRIKEAAQKRGHKIIVLNTKLFSILVEQKRPQLYWKDKLLSHYDAAIPRIGASISFFGTAVVRQFEQMGVYCLNTSQAITSSRDKLRSIQILSRHRIGIPKTAFVRERSQVIPAIESVGGAPVVIKVLEGTQGIGVILASTIKIAEAIIETLQSAKQNVLIQKFVAESKGKDVRAFVVGDRVVAAMRRSAQGDEFRSNVHRGGSVAKVDLTPAYQQAAVYAAQIMGLDVAGVDMLEGNDGPNILEVNSSPGLEGIESATGVDVAGSMIEYLEQQVLFPSIDLRQRMSAQSGYRVVELSIGAETELANKRLRETRLRERDIMVLSIQRGSVTIPNPKGDQEILSGDVLLCFGKMETLKHILPAKKEGKRKKGKKKMKQKGAQ